MGWGETWRTCRYCGSIHPDDLLAAIRVQGIAPALTDDDYARWALGDHSQPLRPGPGLYIDEADWKYGYPHKLYIDGLPSAMAGQQVETGAQMWTDETGVRRSDPIFSTQQATTGAKFYARHLHHASDFEALAAALHEAIPNVTWTRDESGIIRWNGRPGPGVYG